MKKITRIFATLLAVSLLGVSLFSCSAKRAKSNDAELNFREPAEGETLAIIKTSMGDISLIFFKDVAPLAVDNFVQLAQEGHYNGTNFYYVMEDFMIQGGNTDASDDTIYGGAFDDEFSNRARPFYGALCMANSGENTNTNQFFIVNVKTSSDEKINRDITNIEERISDYTNNRDRYITRNGFDVDKALKDLKKDLKFSKNFKKQLESGSGNMSIFKDNPGAYWFDGKNTVFGKVISGMDVVDKIAAVEKSNEGEPVEEVTINSIEITQYRK